MFTMYAPSAHASAVQRRRPRLPSHSTLLPPAARSAIASVERTARAAPDHAALAPRPRPAESAPAPAPRCCRPGSPALACHPTAPR